MPHVTNGVVVLSLVAAMAPCVGAQQSVSYTLTESVFNQGGHPADGVVPVSASYRLTLDSIGDGATGVALTSASFRLDGGFIAAYPPPSEVYDLRLLADRATIVWSPEASIGSYNLYRDLLSDLSGLDYGRCEQQGIQDEMTGDPSSPPPADGYFYLVTAENRLGEEGTMGRNSSGGDRPNNDPCP